MFTFKQLVLYKNIILLKWLHNLKKLVLVHHIMIQDAIHSQMGQTSEGTAYGALVEWSHLLESGNLY